MKNGATEAITTWLREKLAEAEKSLRAREQMEQLWRTGTNVEWEAAAKSHPSIVGKPLIKRADRLKESSAQGRIASRCRRDVEMFKTLLNSLGGWGRGESAAFATEPKAQNDQDQQ